VLRLLRPEIRPCVTLHRDSQLTFWASSESDIPDGLDTSYFFYSGELKCRGYSGNMEYNFRWSLSFLLLSLEFAKTKKCTLGKKRHVSRWPEGKGEDSVDFFDFFGIIRICLRYKDSILRLCIHPAIEISIPRDYYHFSQLHPPLWVYPMGWTASPLIFSCP